MHKFLVLVGLMAVVGFSSCKSKKEKKEVGKLPVTTPIQLDTSVTKEYIAEIQSIQNIEVRAKVKGYLESIKVDEGQLVSAGQLLFTIRSRDFDADLAKAQAALRTAELEMQNVKILADKRLSLNRNWVWHWPR